MDTLKQRQWHRRVAWLALCAGCTFALTGVLHPLMTRMQPQPVHRLPPPAQALPASLPAPAGLLTQAGISSLTGLTLVPDATRWLWRVRLPDDQVQWLDASSGALQAPKAERLRAGRLARWYTGQPDAAIIDIEQIHAFDADYSYVNRLLPVWRVRFDDAAGLTAYVSTEESRLATLSDRNKRWFQRAFRALHTWAWLPAPVRNSWINLLLAGLAGTTLLGLSLAVTSGGRRRITQRRWHRWGGVVVSAAALAWALSGFVQARDNQQREQAQAVQRTWQVASSALTASLSVPSAGVDGLSLVQVQGAPVWRWRLKPPTATTGQGLALSEHHAQPMPKPETPPMAIYVSALDGAALPLGEQQHLDELRHHFGTAPPAGPATLVQAFTAEYGFLFKRLPVWRIEQRDARHTALFIDTDSERLSAQVDDADRFKGNLFALAHKWEWVSPWAGKNVRDALTTLFAALLIVVALVGLSLRWRR